jgi:hypothetical protein
MGITVCVHPESGVTPILPSAVYRWMVTTWPLPRMPPGGATSPQCSKRAGGGCHHTLSPRAKTWVGSTWPSPRQNWEAGSTLISPMCLEGRVPPWPLMMSPKKKNWRSDPWPLPRVSLFIWRIGCCTLNPQVGWSPVFDLDLLFFSSMSLDVFFFGVFCLRSLLSSCRTSCVFSVLYFFFPLLYSSFSFLDVFFVTIIKEIVGVKR